MPQALPPLLAVSQRFWKVAFLTLAVALHPVTASANAGTPLMWAEILHMVVGNLFIGIFEGFLLSWFFQTPRAASIGVMILANYLSAWLGMGILANFHAPDPLSLSNATSWLWLMLGITYVLTLLLEWPFVAWMFRGRPHLMGKSIRASLLVQTCSYALLVFYYGEAGHMSLDTRTKIVGLNALSLPEHVMVYYIHHDDGDIYRRALLGGNPSKVMELNSKSTMDRLFVRRNSERASEWDLVARLEPPSGREPEFVTVALNIKSGVAPGARARDVSVSLDGGIWDSVGAVDRLDQSTPSSWRFRTGYWAADGLKAANTDTGEKWKLALETPFIDLLVRSAVQLPGDKVLFQLGPSEIYILDPVTLQMALLCQGRGPVATLENADGGAGTIIEEPPPRGR